MSLFSFIDFCSDLQCFLLYSLGLVCSVSSLLNLKLRLLILELPNLLRLVLWPNVWSALEAHLNVICALPLLGGAACKWESAQLIDSISVSQVFHILPDFLSSSENFWERHIEVFKYTFWVVYSSFKSAGFCFMHFGAVLLNVYPCDYCSVSLIYWPFCHYELFPC